MTLMELECHFLIARRFSSEIDWGADKCLPVWERKVPHEIDAISTNAQANTFSRRRFLPTGTLSFAYRHAGADMITSNCRRDLPSPAKHLSEPSLVTDWAGRISSGPFPLLKLVNEKWIHFHMTSCGPAGCRLLNGGGQSERSVAGGCRCRATRNVFEFSIFEIALLKQGSYVRCLATASDAREEIRRTGAGNEQDKKTQLTAKNEILALSLRRLVYVLICALSVLPSTQSLRHYFCRTLTSKKSQVNRKQSIILKPCCLYSAHFLLISDRCCLPRSFKLCVIVTLCCT